MTKVHLEIERLQAQLSGVKKAKRVARRANPNELVFYVYALIDPRSGQPFYIGKGKGRRHDVHVAEWRCGRGRNVEKIDRITEIVEAGHAIAVKIVVKGMNEYQAYRRERAEIALAKKNGIELTNASKGKSACDAIINLRRVHYNLRRFRSRMQYRDAIRSECGREPTLDEWARYHDSLNWWIEMRSELQKQVLERYGDG